MTTTPDTTTMALKPDIYSPAPTSTTTTSTTSTASSTTTSGRIFNGKANPVRPRKIGRITLYFTFVILLYLI